VQALAGQTVMNVERRVRRPDGTEIITQTSAAPVEVEDGGRLGAVAVFRDVTAERELEREKDAFLSAAAHDLKTPLTTIKGLAEIVRRRILRGDAGETSRVLENLERIEVAATRMSRLVNDLLDASRTQMGRRLDLSRSRVDLAAMVRRLTSEIQHSTRGHHLVMESSVPALLGVWDADRLERVFMNLLTNAVKYSPEGGTIAVRVTPEYGSAGAWAVVSVHDQGLGIPARDLPYIFERFYRAGNVEGQIQGTGIGLASARQIVEQHGGTIEVASKEGDSTTVTVRLPLQPEVSDGAECGWKLDSDLR
jgi:signal transduction histidine kinase